MYIHVPVQRMWSNGVVLDINLSVKWSCLLLLVKIVSVRIGIWNFSMSWDRKIHSERVHFHENTTNITSWKLRILLDAAC